MKKIAILGSTGSIGTQTLEIVRDNPDLQVMGLAAGSNAALMEKQIREFHPALAVMWSEEAAKELRGRTADLPVKVLSGMEDVYKRQALVRLYEATGDDKYLNLSRFFVDQRGTRPYYFDAEHPEAVKKGHEDELRRCV